MESKLNVEWCTKHMQCDLVLEDEEEQKRVGTCLAESSLTISFPKFEILD